MADYRGIDYWGMSDEQLRAEWRECAAADYSLEGDPDGGNVERLNFVEDAILQRIGADEDASGDEPVWQERIRAFGEGGGS